MSETALATPDPEDLPGDQRVGDNHIAAVAGHPIPPTETSHAALPKRAASRWAAALLSIYADNLDGFERLRIDTEGRLRSIQMDKGGDGTSPEEERLQATCDTLRTLEHGAEMELKRALRKHPLGGWVKATVGVGEKQGARLIAAIGDPYWNAASDRPRRGPAELWAYCGYHVLHPDQRRNATQRTTVGVDLLGPDHANGDSHGETVGADPSDTADHRCTDPYRHSVGGVAPRRRRGHKANWNTTAKMRARLVAESCIKQAHSPYRAVYDRARSKTADSDLTPLHQHNRALRKVAKAVLKDLFLEAKRLHENGQWA